MKQDNIIYWVSTGIFCALMLMSGFMYFTSPEAKAGFAHIGLPDWFREELGTAKILGAITLLLPMIHHRVKEWAYAGFGIVLISASYAHLITGDGIGKAAIPFFFLGVLVLSYTYWHRLRLKIA